MPQRKAKRVRRKFTPAEKRRWTAAVRETDAQRDEILGQGRAVFAARLAAREALRKLKAERHRRGLSLADMMEKTGMSRSAISRLENDEQPNPTLQTLMRYADALGMQLRLSVAKPRVKS